MRKILLFALVFWSSPAKADTLSAAQIHEQLVGQLIAWSDRNGWSTGSLFLLPGGKAEITVDDPNPAHDAGQWTMHGNQICTVWSSMRNNKPKCYSVTEISPGHFLTSGGNAFEVRSFGV